MSTLPITQAPAALAGLADRINEEHQAAGEALNRSLHHARAAGDLLVQAKAHLGHGQWSAWLAENFRGSARTAQGYMRLASRFDELESKAQRVADLPLREALRALAEPRDASPAAETDLDELTANAQKIFPALVPPPGHSLRGVAGDSTAVIEESDQGAFYHVTAIHWGWGEHGQVYVSKKPVRWNHVNGFLHFLAFDWHAAAWTVTKADAPKNFNRWLSASPEEYAQHLFLVEEAQRMVGAA